MLPPSAALDPTPPAPEDASATVSDPDLTAPEPAFTSVLSDVRDATRSEWDCAWVGMEPTFTNPKILRLWHRYSRDEATEVKFFNHPYLLKMEQSVAKAIAKKCKKALRAGSIYGLFDQVKRHEDLDQWGDVRQDVTLRCQSDAAPHHALHVRFGMDPETLEFSIKPVPVRWLYDERFVQLLQELVWDVPQQKGLAPSIAHGGCQFSISAKTYLRGSLLCDDLADKWNHPELSTWVMDYPNCDDRCFRATRRRREAFQRIIAQYWAGAFHPRAIGELLVENAFFDHGFAPAISPPEGLMSREYSSVGPIGTPHEIFQTNFAFARAVRLLAQNIHPGYWQQAHPDSVGYRPDQIMRYSEGNLNRLRIVGEYHVKSGQVLDPARIPELDAPLEQAHLYDEASWENRAQYGRTSARDFVEAILLDVHRAQYLQKFPGVRLRQSLLQDQLHGDAEETLIRHGQEARLQELRAAARKSNLEGSGQRIHSDFIEPEDLFWAAWHALPKGEQAAIAREVILGFSERVTEACTCDPRPQSSSPPDPLAWHRHRIHPILWQAVASDTTTATLQSRDPVVRELARYQQDEALYLSRRPPFDLSGGAGPWVR